MHVCGVFVHVVVANHACSSVLTQGACRAADQQDTTEGTRPYLFIIISLDDSDNWKRHDSNRMLMNRLKTRIKVH